MTITIMRSIVSLNESSKTVLTDSLSVPKIIGKGPMMMAQPPLTFPSPLMLERKSKKIATKMTSIPANIKAMPKP